MQNHYELDNHSEDKLKVTIIWLFIAALAAIAVFGLLWLFFPPESVDKDFLVDDLTPTAYASVEQKIFYPMPLPELKDYPVFDNWKNTSLEEAILPCSGAAWYFGVSSQIFVGISFAESTFKNFPKDSFNPWGFGGKDKLMRFKHWHESCNFFASTIKYNYLEQGLDTPEKIFDKYAGHESSNWIPAVRTYWPPEFCEASLKC